MLCVQRIHHQDGFGATMRISPGVQMFSYFFRIIRALDTCWIPRWYVVISDRCRRCLDLVAPVKCGWFQRFNRYHVSMWFPCGFIWLIYPYLSASQWRHNGRDGFANHQPHDCLLKRFFRRRSKKTSKLRVTDLCEGNSPVTPTNGQ